MRVSRITAMAMALGLAVTSSSLRAQGQGNAQPQSGDVEVEGTLDVHVEDAVNGSQVHQFLETATGRMRLKEKPGKSELTDLGLETGTRVKVRGRKNGNTELELAGGTTSSVTSLALAASNTFGEQRVVVILVNFQDNPATPYGWSDAYNVTFGQASDFYRQNSYNQTWLTGDVFGWYTIPMSSAGCDYYQISTLADQAATNAGVNLNNYTRRVYAFPKNSCTWWGIGNVGGNPSRAWVNGQFAVKVVAHELGHNFGDYHSKSQECNGTTCTISDYGDDRDMMGGPASGYFHAYQKERLGWLNYGSSPTVQSVSSSGTYRIGNYESGGAPSALKILKSATSSDQTYYYIEARAQVGFDAPYAPGVVLHTGSSVNGDSAIEVDLDTSSASFDSLLDPGQTFTDSAAGVTVTTVSADDSGAWVTITYAGVPCTAASPTVTLSPNSTVAAPGVTANYTMTVSNKDDARCAPAGFGIGMSVPSGWSWSAAQPSITVAPGSTAGTTVSVTPPMTASGSSTVSAMASRTGSGPSGSGVANLTVANDLTVSVSATGGSQYQVNVSVRAGSSPAAGASVSFRITDPKGVVTSASATTNSSGTAVFKDRLKGKDPHGTYTVIVSVTSSSLTGSGTATFVY
jgi:hypothetical protein